MQAFDSGPILSNSPRDILGADGKIRKGDRRSTIKALKVSSELEKQGVAVEEYVTRCLSGTLSGAFGTIQLLTAQSYTSLLPTLWWLLGRESDQSESSALVSDISLAILGHATKVGPMSGVKRVATEFVGRLVLVSCSGFEGPGVGV